MIKLINKIDLNYDTIIIFTCGKQLSDMEKLLKIKFPKKVKEDFKKEEMINFYTNDINIILVEIKECNDKYANDISGIIGKQIYDTNKKTHINLN